MKIAVVKETFPSERRVALIPTTVASLVKGGHEVFVESGAGVAAGFPDNKYTEAGAKITKRAEAFAAADCVLQIRALGSNPEAGRADLPLTRAGQVIIGMCDPRGNPEAVRELAERGVT